MDDTETKAGQKYNGSARLTKDDWKGIGEQRESPKWTCWRPLLSERDPHGAIDPNALTASLLWHSCMGSEGNTRLSLLRLAVPEDAYEQAETVWRGLIKSGALIVSGCTSCGDSVFGKVPEADNVCYVLSRFGLVRLECVLARLADQAGGPAHRSLRFCVLKAFADLRAMGRPPLGFVFNATTGQHQALRDGEGWATWTVDRTVHVLRRLFSQDTSEEECREAVTNLIQHGFLEFAGPERDMLELTPAGRDALARGGIPGLDFPAPDAGGVVGGGDTPHGEGTEAKDLPEAWVKGPLKVAKANAKWDVNDFDLLYSVLVQFAATYLPVLTERRKRAKTTGGYTVESGLHELRNWALQAIYAQAKPLESIGVDLRAVRRALTDFPNEHEPSDAKELRRAVRTLHIEWRQRLPIKALHGQPELAKYWAAWPVHWKEMLSPESASWTDEERKRRTKAFWKDHEVVWDETALAARLRDAYDGIPPERQEAELRLALGEWLTHVRMGCQTLADVERLVEKPPKKASIRETFSLLAEYQHLAPAACRASRTLLGLYRAYDDRRFRTGQLDRLDEMLKARSEIAAGADIPGREELLKELEEVCLLLERPAPKVGAVGVGGAPVAPSPDTGGRPGDEEGPALLHDEKLGTWRLLWPGSEALPLRDCRGLHYLRYILQHQGEDVSSEKVFALDKKDRQRRRAADQQVAMDPDTVTDCKKTLAGIERDIEDLESEPDGPAKDEKTARLTEDHKRIQLQLARAMGRGGKRRPLQDDGARVAVSQAIKRGVMDRLPEGHPVRVHLESALQTGGTCAYKPPAKVDWVLE
jgi:hypothetical protein